MGLATHMRFDTKIPDVGCKEHGHTTSIIGQFEAYHIRLGSLAPLLDLLTAEL